jgi:hypothetical protein
MAARRSSAEERERIPLSLTPHTVRTFGPQQKSPFEQLVMGDLMAQSGVVRPLSVPKVSFLSPGGGQPFQFGGGGDSGGAAGGMRQFPTSAGPGSTTTTQAPAPSGAAPYTGLVNPLIKAGQKAWEAYSGGGAEVDPFGGIGVDSAGVTPAAAPSADYLGGGLQTLSGLMQLYQATQGGGVGAGLGGAGSTLSGLGKLFPGQTQALSQALGLGAGGLGLATSGLGGLAGGYGLYQGISQGDPLQAIQGAAGLYSGLAPIVNYFGGIAGTQLPTLTGLAGQALSSIGSYLGLTGGTTAATTASTAAPAAAAGSTAALGPIAMAAGPYIVGKLFELGVELTEGKEQGARTGKQFEKLMGDLPHQAKAIEQTAPELLASLEGASPQQAVEIFGKLQAIQDQFGGSGMENFLRQGETASQYGDFAKGVSAKFPESQNVYKALQPGLGALTLGRLKAQDIAQAGGLTDPRFFTPQAAALQLGQELYSSSEAGSPGAWSVKAANPWIAANYRDPWAGYSDLDIASGQGSGVVSRDYVTGTKSWTPEALEAFKGFQPGGLVSGLSELFGGQFSPAIQGWTGSPSGPAPGALGAPEPAVSAPTLPGTPTPAPTPTATGPALPQTLPNSFSGGLLGLAAPQMNQWMKLSPLAGGFA